MSEPLSTDPLPTDPRPASPLPAAQPRTKSRAGCVIALVFLVIGMFALFSIGVYFFFFSLSNLFAPGDIEIADGSVLEIQLTGALPDSPEEIDFGGLFGIVDPPSLWGLRTALGHAADDPNIVGARVWIHASFFGWATAEEVVQLLDEFRESGKPVHAQLQADIISDLDYYLATAADRIWVTRTASAAVNGLAAEAQFFRGTLEKLRIEPQVQMYKEYKSAGEQFANYEMSDAMREALTAVMATTSDRFHQRVVDRRPIDGAALDEFLSRGLASAAELVEAGLADDFGFADQIEEALIAATGIDGYEGVDVGSYARSVGAPFVSGDRIAVVFGEGQIVAEPIADFPLFGSGLMSGPAVAADLRNAVDDPSVSAVVFRVNSPGGSPVGSDVVHREVLRAKELGKPVIVSMGDLAGSGGYWVAMGADAIVAHPTTITGSIGVVATHFDLDGFWEWIGAGTDTVKTDPRADILSFKDWDERDEEIIRDWMESSYTLFVESVAAGRGMTPEEVEEIAKGRIWSGTDALERGLIDELGGLETAIRIARERVGEDLPVKVYPEPKTLFEEIFSTGFGVRSDPPTPLQILDELTVLAEPQVRAQMPEIRVH